MPTPLILLAAGASSRLGSPKQLLPFDGKTLLRHAIDTAIAANCSPILVVLGANADKIHQECDGLPVRIVHNPQWSEGMASSVRYGIAALENLEVADAAILLVDQPLVTPVLLQALIKARQRTNHPAAACDYGEGAIGPPCVFDRSLFPELLALRGAHGAKQLLTQLPPEAITTLPFPDASRDVDTPEDWARLATVISSD